jgi:hypothetical protein
MAEEGYTTIFHPGEEGVTIHKKSTVSITTTEPPVLNGSKPKGVKLWTTSANYSIKKKERANNAYYLPSISQMVKYVYQSNKSRKPQHMADHHSCSSPMSLS